MTTPHHEDPYAEDRRAANRNDDEPVLPQQTRDDDPRGWGEHPDGGDSDDERILREVPPHH